MSHGPTIFDSKGCCIYCGATGIKLTDEHIVPLSLSGVHVIREASCERCAKITTGFERKVARNLWGDARNAFDQPSRRKKSRSKAIAMIDANDQSQSFSISASEYPAGFIFYKMLRAGLLQGLPEDFDVSAMWQFVVIDSEKRRKRFLERHPDKKITLRFQHVPTDFGRLIAKIGYGHILSLLDPGNFRPICLPYILGSKQNISYVVGGTLDDQTPEPEHGYSLSTRVFGRSDRIMLLALIRLYANTASPAYHVVVGDVIGKEAVDRALKKLGPGDSLEAEVGNASRLGAEHWMPTRWPLPIWGI